MVTSQTQTHLIFLMPFTSMKQTERYSAQFLVTSIGHLLAEVFDSGYLVSWILKYVSSCGSTPLRNSENSIFIALLIVEISLRLHRSPFQACPVTAVTKHARRFLTTKMTATSMRMTISEQFERIQSSLPSM
jgi:hypothetical protein